MNSPIKNAKYVLHPAGDLTQGFGENPTLYRPWGLEGHNGIDLVRPHGEPLYAVEDGIIVDVKYDPSGFGKHIRMRSTKKYNGRYREWTYGHCATIRVVPGTHVEGGAYIATMGNTGFVVSGSTPFWKSNPYAGTHLHLGLRYLVPDAKGWKYPGDTITYQIENYSNGYKGAVNPIPTLIDEPISDVNKQLYIQLLTIQSMINALKQKLGIV